MHPCVYMGYKLVYIFKVKVKRENSIKFEIRFQLCANFVSCFHLSF